MRAGGVHPPIIAKFSVFSSNKSWFCQCDTLGALIEKRFDEIHLIARAKQAHIVDKCFECIAGLQLSKSNREIIVRLPLE